MKFTIYLILLLSGISISINAQNDSTAIPAKVNIEVDIYEWFVLKANILELRIEELEREITTLEQQNFENVPQERFVQIRNRLKYLQDSIDQLSPDTVFISSAPKLNLAAMNPVRRTIALHPLRLLQGTFQASFEHVIGHRFSAEIGFMGTYVTRNGIGGNYLGDQNLETYDNLSGIYRDYFGDMMVGYGFSFKLKNFLLNRLDSNKKSPLGIWAGPSFMFRHLEIRGVQNYWDGEEYLQREIIRHVDVGSIGLLIGVQVATFKVLSIDIWGGGMLRLSKYFDESRITRYKRWNNIDYSGVLPVAGIRIGILK